MSMVKLPRVALGHWPTPLHELPHLSAALGGPRIFVKRDDLSGLALGGNKCRKLEYVLADALKNGVDTLITSGSSQSNHALQTAAAARKLGMEAYLVLVKGMHVETQGNLLLQNILNSTVNIVEVADPSEMFTTMPRKMNELADELRSKGRTPLVIPAGAEFPLGTVGWVDAAEEIGRQLKDQEIDAQYVVLAHSGGGTQAGLVLGFKQLKLPLNVVGISTMYQKSAAVNEVVTLANDTARLLGFDVTITPDEVTLYDDYIGEGYGIPTEGCIEAIRLVAQTEAIFLDPVYSAKAMAGFVDLIRKGEFTSKDTVLFIHTGGVPALFAYHQELAG
ncbi:D-cysteine desulfhydrase family protein [Dehalococcoidia bacterium]|nr:D-cysteine desulfhydrase family protein [Dehalococcoidia bacterium]MCL0103540.1 D-cysteine desulfhydrase family protein [Dehalococcoidia bacterium]